MSQNTSKKAKKTPKKPAKEVIVVVGAGSFLGKMVLKILESSSKFKKIIAIDHRNPGVTLKKTKFYKLDLTQTLADVTLAEILKKENCTTLVHVAFPTSPIRNESLRHEVVAIGSYYIFNACASAKVKKIIMASTADVYGAHPQNPNYLTESHPLKGYLQNRILADRIDAEKQAKKYIKKYPKTTVTVLRLSHILGSKIRNFKTKYLSRKVIFTMLGFDPLLQFVHEDDVEMIFKKALLKNHHGFFNVASDGVLPLSQVVEILKAKKLSLTQFGFKTLVQSLWYLDVSPAPANYADFLRYICLVDNAKIKSEFDFEFSYSTKETLLDFKKSLGR